MQGSEYDFSFSGLKTAVINLVHNAAQKGETVNVNDMAASFQNTISDILVDKAMLAAKDLGYTTIGLAGGVSANSGVREKLQKACDKRGYKLYMPEFKYCGDTYETATRNTLDLSCIPVLREKTHLPILVDPSHATGVARLVKPMSVPLRC